MESPSPQSKCPKPSSNRSTSDVPTAISLLEDVIFVAESSIRSVSSSLNYSTAWRNSELLCACPYDARHLMPPESLFRHSLVCSSSPGTGTPLFDLGFLKTLHYPNSLKSESQLQKDNRFISSLRHHESDASSDLCFSLHDADSEPLASSRFFYKDCPGVVSFPNPEPDPDSPNKTFLLPAILSAECANFMHPPDVDVVVDGGGTKVSQTSGEIKILPSEFWALRCEVEAWRDYPATYSYTVLRVASGLDKVEECGLKRWVISNSPRFGILIDSAMRDHVSILFKLCLKVIRTEALCSLKSLLTDQISISNLKATSFESPKLVGSLIWLASQLSVLYGEANGKLFTIAMLRESLLRVGFSSTLFKFGRAKSGQNDCVSITGDGISRKGSEHSESKSAGGLQFKKNMEDSDGCRVFVSQIAAAVAALHERFLLEEKIQGLRFPQPLPKPQLLKEYLYASTRAGEIRGKRSNYRAVSEHDGLLWQRGNNQDLGKAKTREELLAEERDYKRRRMSYRGKKVKRNTTEVLRDIIEEHMEEIMQAGGIGYNAQDTAGVDVFPIDQNSNGRTANIHDFQHCKHEVPETKVCSPGYEKPLHLYSNDKSKNNQ